MEDLNLSVNENGNTIVFTHNQWKVMQKALKCYASAQNYYHKNKELKGERKLAPTMDLINLIAALVL